MLAAVDRHTDLIAKHTDLMDQHTCETHQAIREAHDSVLSVKREHMRMLALLEDIRKQIADMKKGGPKGPPSLGSPPDQDR